MSRSPLPIPQLDGDSSNEAFEENYCKVCEEWTDEIETSEDVNYHVMNEHEANAVLSKYGHEWVNQRKYCIRKDSPFEVIFPRWRRRCPSTLWHQSTKSAKESFYIFNFNPCKCMFAFCVSQINMMMMIYFVDTKSKINLWIFCNGKLINFENW